jgi:hypothetical protein
LVVQEQLVQQETTALPVMKELSEIMELPPLVPEKLEALLEAGPEELEVLEELEEPEEQVVREVPELLVLQ